MNGIPTVCARSWSRLWKGTARLRRTRIPLRTRRMRSEARPSRSLRVIFDPVNLLGPENIDQRERVLGEATDKLCDHIAVVHLKDYVRADGRFVSVAATKPPWRPSKTERSSQSVESVLSMKNLLLGYVRGMKDMLKCR